MVGVNNWRTTLEWPLNKDDFPAIEYSYEDDNGNTHTDFNMEAALAAMLLSEAVFLNDHWWKKNWPEEARRASSINVNINDVFVWGCADAESIGYNEIEDIYRYWIKDRSWGTAVWAMIKRREMPQAPVESEIRSRKIWDLDALQEEHNLRPNFYDGVSKVWEEYNKANPGCHDEGDPYEKELDALTEQWKKDNGWEN